MKISWRYALLSLALVLLLGLAFWNQGVVFASLIDPITRILWLLFRLILVVDQSVYWMVLILAAFIVGLLMVPGRSEPSYRSSYANPPSPWNEDRTAHWDALLQSAEDGPLAQLALQKELENLNRSIESLAEGNGLEQINLPPIRSGLRQRLQAAYKHSFLFRLIPQPGGRPPTELDQRVEFILNSMETRLEINNDRSSRNANDD